MRTIKYTYTEYKQYPEATEISHLRERNKAISAGGGILTAVFSLIFVFLDFKETWPLLFLTMAAIAYELYLFFYYDKVTERKIQKAINKRSIMMNEVQNSTYKNKYIKHLGEHSKGKCRVCLKETEFLELCRVKNDVGIRDIFICGSCINQFERDS